MFEANETRHKVIHVRISEEEMKLLKKASKKARVTVSSLVRDALDYYTNSYKFKRRIR